MARRYTSIGGVRVNTGKTPRQVVDQLNRQMDTISNPRYSLATRNMSYNNRMGVMLSSTAKRKYGIEYDNESRVFRLNKKGRMNSNMKLAAIGGAAG